MQLARINIIAVLLGLLMMMGCTDNKNKPAASTDDGKQGRADAMLESCADASTGATPVPVAVAGGLHFGPVFKLADKDTASVSALLADPAAYNGKYVRVSGKVTDVCEKKGCWLTFGDPKLEESVFVKFTDPAQGRLVPMSAHGREIIAEGTFKIGTISEGFARELVLDSGGTREEAMKITGPQKKLMLMTPAVTIVGLEK